MCKETKVQRQLNRERERKNIQRIMTDPASEIATALMKQSVTRKRQAALDNFIGKQMIPRSYEIYMQDKLDLPEQEYIDIMGFELHEQETAKLIERAINKMAKNKSAGEDQLHTEMFKANVSRIARTFSKCWKAVGRTKILPPQWLKGIIVPIFKGKG